MGKLRLSDGCVEGRVFGAHWVEHFVEMANSDEVCDKLCDEDASIDWLRSAGAHLDSATTSKP